MKGIEEYRDFTNEEVDAYLSAKEMLYQLSGFVIRKKMFGEGESEPLTDAQKDVLDLRASAYNQKAKLLLHDFQDNTRIVDKYSPIMRANQLTLNFFLNDTI